MNDQTEVEKIKTVLKQIRDMREYVRVVVVSMVYVKRLALLVATATLGVGRYTVSNWLAIYDRNGLDGIVDDARSDRLLSYRATSWRR